jgi:hypothetical protein
VAICSAITIVAMAAVWYWLSRPQPKLPAEEIKVLKPEVANFFVNAGVEPLSAVAGRPYTQTLGTSGGSLPISWATTEGSLPSGLSLNRQTGLIEGTPDNAGTYSFVVQAIDSRGNTTQRRLTLYVAEPPKEIAPAKQLPVVKPKAADPRKQTVVQVKPDAPSTVLPTPTKPTNVQEPCKTKTFVLDQYGDSRAGELTWTGSLSGASQLEIRNRHPSIGYIRGDILPLGVPIRVSVIPDSVRILAAPSAGNCWESRLLLQNSGPATATIKIMWVVYQP